MKGWVGVVLVLLLGGCQDAIIPPTTPLPTPLPSQPSLVDGTDAGLSDSGMIVSGSTDSGVVVEADAGLLDSGTVQDDAGEVLGEIASGTLCGVEVRERFALQLSPDRLYRVRLETQGDDDPDLHLYFADTPGQVELLGRAVGADSVVIRGRQEVSWLAEVSSPFGDCERYTLVVERASDLDSESPTQISEMQTLSGQIDYTDLLYGPGGFTSRTLERGAPGVRIELVRESGEIIATSTTHADGAFSFEVPLGPNTNYRLRALAVLEAFGQWARVRDRSDSPAIYSEEGPLFRGDSPSSLTLVGAPENFGAALNILHASWRAYQLIARNTEQKAPLLSYNWQRGLAFGCGSCLGGNTISLGGQLEDPDEYDDDIIIHEFGHYFIAHYAPDDSPGGTHRDNRVSPQLAWGEGIAYFFSAMVRETPEVVDNYLNGSRFTDLETVTLDGQHLADFLGSSDGTLAGNQREELVGGLVWDAYDDDTDETFDTLALGEQGVMRVLLEHMGGRELDIGPPGAELSDWFLGLQCFDAGTLDRSQTLLEQSQLPFPPQVETTSCEQKTRRDEPPMDLKRQGHQLLIDLHGKRTQVSVGMLLSNGTMRVQQSISCKAQCEVPFRGQGAVFAQAEMQGHLVTRTLVRRSAQDAFTGGHGRRVPHPKVGPLRLMPSLR